MLGDRRQQLLAQLMPFQQVPAGPVELSVDTDGFWMVLLEPMFCP